MFGGKGIDARAVAKEIEVSVYSSYTSYILKLTIFTDICSFGGSGYDFLWFRLVQSALLIKPCLMGSVIAAFDS